MKAQWDAETEARETAARAAVPAASPPGGYSIVGTAPAADLDLKGETVLFKWDGAPLPIEKFGWYHGTVVGPVSAAEKRKNAAFTHMVMYANSETGGVLPACAGVKGARARASFPLGLGADVWGATQKWVLLRDDALDL